MMHHHLHSESALPWVFTACAGEDTRAYDEMTKVAVLTAQANTRLSPIICVFDGSSGHTSDLPHWLEARGVRVIHHTPTWRATLLSSLVASENKHLTATSSPLYADATKLAGTFLRVDVPMLPALRVHELVLYADVDILFLSDVRASMFYGRSSQPPSYFTLGADVDGLSVGRSWSHPTGNAGVMLMNMTGLRQTHAAFLRFMLSPDKLYAGLHFGRFGPVDQGACEHRSR